MKVRHVVPVLKVSEIRQSLEFYCTGLGFRTDFEYAASDSGPFYAGLSCDGCQLHLSTFPGDSVRGSATYFYVDDIDAFYSGIRERGLTTPMEPTNQDWGMREVYLRDPDGNQLRFGSPLKETG